MIDIMPDDKEISKALNVLNSISDKLRFCGGKYESSFTGWASGLSV